MKTHFVGITTAAALGALTTLTASDARAAGTALDVQSGRATGMAAATTAMIDDSSAIFYNPAGIVQGKGVATEAGMTLISPAYRQTTTSGERTSMPFSVVTPFQAYLAGGVTDNLSLGIGVFTPYGLSIKWPDGWVGRSQITSASLRTYYVNPTIGYRFGPLRVGAGFQLVRATLELKRDINFGDRYGSADLGGGAWGAGANVGMQLEAIKQYLSFGVHYRSAVKLDFDDADVNFSGVPAGFAGTLRDQPVRGSITQPDSLAFGVATRPTKRLVVDFDAVWFGWSKFRSVALTYPEDATGSLNSTQPKDWHNTVNFHVGAEGIVSDHWTLRGGVLYDPSPSPDSTLTPEVPDSTRVNLAVGATYRTDGGFHADVGYQFIVITNRASTAPQLPGDYGGFVNLLGVSLGFTTPKRVARALPSVPPSFEAPQPMPQPPPPIGAAAKPKTPKM